jgi:hypothetical protein
MKIRIIGSMKFLEKYKEIKQELEKQGHKVILPKPDEAFDSKNIKLEAMKEFNEDLEKSDAILIANYDKDDKKCHIGVNSLMEIGMAFNRNKKIFIFNDIPESCKDELQAVGSIVLNNDLSKVK